MSRSGSLGRRLGVGERDARRPAGEAEHRELARLERRVRPAVRGHPQDDEPGRDLDPLR